MIEKTVSIQNPTGLHARPASQFVQKASSFKSSVKLVKNGKEVDAKSLLGVMSLAAKQNDQVTVKVDGEDEAEAVEILVDFLANLRD